MYSRRPGIQEAPTVISGSDMAMLDEVSGEEEEINGVNQKEGRPWGPAGSGRQEALA